MKTQRFVNIVALATVLLIVYSVAYSIAAQARTDSSSIHSPVPDFLRVSRYAIAIALCG